MSEVYYCSFGPSCVYMLSFGVFFDHKIRFFNDKQRCGGDYFALTIDDGADENFVSKDRSFHRATVFPQRTTTVLTTCLPDIKYGLDPETNWT